MDIKSINTFHPKGHDTSHCFIKYDKIEVVEKTAKNRCMHGIRKHVQSWSEFINDYITEFQKNALHHTTWIRQHQQKLLLLGTVPKGSQVLRWDCINDPEVRYHHLTSNMWRTKKKFALMIGV